MRVCVAVCVWGGGQTVIDAELFQAVDEMQWLLEDDKDGCRLLTIELEKRVGVVGHMRWISLTR